MQAFIEGWCTCPGGKSKIANRIYEKHSNYSISSKIRNQIIIIRITNQNKIKKKKKSTVVLVLSNFIWRENAPERTNQHQAQSFKNWENSCKNGNIQMKICRTLELAFELFISSWSKILISGSQQIWFYQMKMWHKADIRS